MSNLIDLKEDILNIANITHKMINFFVLPTIYGSAVSSQLLLSGMPVCLLP